MIKTKSLNLPLSTRLFFKIIFKVLQEVQIVLSQSIAAWRIAFSRLVALRFQPYRKCFCAKPGIESAILRAELDCLTTTLRLLIIAYSSSVDRGRLAIGVGWPSRVYSKTMRFKDWGIKVNFGISSTLFPRKFHAYSIIFKGVGPI
jgi:hypothetical protein